MKIELLIDTQTHKKGTVLSVNDNVGASLVRRKLATKALEVGAKGYPEGGIPPYKEGVDKELELELEQEQKLEVKPKKRRGRPSKK